MGERGRFEGDDERRDDVDGELSEGQKADDVEESGRDARMRLEARINASRTRRACKPRLRTLVAVSLLAEGLTLGAELVVVFDLFFAGAVGVKDLRAART